MAARSVTITGHMMGRRVPTDTTLQSELVVRVSSSTQPEPVPESMLLVSVSTDGSARARYLSWIGYADLDEAEALEPDRWEIIEPPLVYRGEASWEPFGRESLELVWTHPPLSERLGNDGRGNGHSFERSALLRSDVFSKRR